LNTRARRSRRPQKIPAGQGPKDIEWLLAQGDLILWALRKAARQAVRQHWAAGYPVSEWRNGRIVWIAPDGRVLDKPTRQRRR
jgi:hypothetical protein